MKLQGKVAIVTGASQGMGRATAELFAAEGAVVIAGDIREPDDAFGTGIEFVRLDVADENSWAEVMGHVRATHGRLDVLVNNAGINSAETLLETTLDRWNQVIGVDMTGVFLGMRESVPLMIETGGGSIINFSSIWGLAAVSTAHAYHAAKGAISNMSKNVAVSYALQGIRANSLHPGHILTPMTETQAEETSALVIGKTAMKRPGLPGEIATAVLFLASDDSSYVTGTELIVDGGYLAQ